MRKLILVLPVFVLTLALLTNVNNFSAFGHNIIQSDPIKSAIQAGTIERVSIADNGTQANNNSNYPSISGDGRFVAFESAASNLVSNDTNGTRDIFVYDRYFKRIERVSIASDGSQGIEGESYDPSISRDGRFVAFTSLATNLVNSDTNGYSDVFVHDRQTGITERVSVASDGTQANNGVTSGYNFPSLSSDGRYVAFSSYASNLVVGDTGYADVFVHDRQTGITSRVSVASDGVTQGNSSSDYPSISADGRFVAFDSYASNFVSGDVNGRDDVFVHDCQTGTTEMVSYAWAGWQFPESSFYPAISSDGRYVAFNSFGFPSYTYGNVYVFDRQNITTERVSVASDGTEGKYGGGNPSISADGRYVAFTSLSYNLAAGGRDTGMEEVYVHDRQTGITERVSVDINGNQGNIHSQTTPTSISADGGFVAFGSASTNLVAGDTNNYTDVFVYNRIDFAPSVYSITGTVALSDGTPIENVSVSNGTNQALTDANGAYILSGMVSGSYTLTPEKTGYDFSPISQTVTIVDSNVPNIDFTGIQKDITPPTTITDLAVVPGIKGGEVTISWTAPSDDEQVNRYDIRYSNTPITNWDDAIRVTNPPIPSTPGAQEQLGITSLDTGVTWYFAIKSADLENNWSELSNQPSFQDSGFRPYPDGYSFYNNDISYQTTDFTKNDFRKMFGDPNVCANPACSEFKPLAQHYYDEILKGLLGGHCAGMTITGLRFYEKMDDFNDYLDPNTIYPSTFEIKLDAIRKRITYFQSSIKGDLPQKDINTALEEQTPSQVLDIVKSLLASTASEQPFLSIFETGKPNYDGGHALLPYAVQEVGNGIWQIWVYDSNHPFGSIIIGNKTYQQYLEINKNTETWHYKALNYTGDEISHTIMVVPNSIFVENQSTADTCPWCNNPPSLQIAMTGNAPLVITDAFGKKFGFDGINFYNEIQGAFRSIFPDIEPETNGQTYYLPTNNQYSVQVGNIITSAKNNVNSIINTEPISISMFGPNSYVSVSNVSPQDTINFSNGNQVSLDSSTTKNTSFEIDNDTYQIILGNVPTGDSKPVSFSVDPATNQITYINPSNQSGKYSLDVEKVGESGIVTFSNPNILVEPNDTQYIDTSKISSSYITVEIDHNSDGTIEQTVSYHNLGGWVIYLPALQK